MGLKQKIKAAVIKRSILKRKRDNPFNAAASEFYRLDNDAPEDMNNSYYFCAFQDDGAAVFCRLGIRGGHTHEIWFTYYDRAGNIYAASDELVPESKSALSVECVEALKIWRFSFKGNLKKCRLDENRIAQKYGGDIPGEFNGTFICTDRLYEFSADTDVFPYSRALSGIKWGKNFRKDLEFLHQIHTEQTGRITGKLTAGERDFYIDAAGIRDHSYGRRVWSGFDRHCWHIASLSNGKTLNTNMVRYPILSELRTGYMIGGEKCLSVLDTTTMDNIGQDGRPPLSFQYETLLTDNKVYKCSAELEAAFPFDFEGGRYRIYEGIGTYSVEGVPGRGIQEFGYNSDKSRWGRALPKRR